MVVEGSIPLLTDTCEYKCADLFEHVFYVSAPDCLMTVL